MGTDLYFYDLHGSSRPGVDNSLDFAGHIRDKLGIPGPVRVNVNWF